MAAEARIWPAALAALLTAAVLAGCAGTPVTRPSAGRPAMPAAGDEGTAAGAAGASGRRAGAYYLDDGPGERPPEEVQALLALPEPLPVAEPLHSWANRPYRVMGNDYRPMTQREPFLKRGVASWYGKKFHGQLTSIGERYDMYAMTAAHPTLPLPSFVRVTNLENAKSVVVRVNDRGPFLHGRAIDLSYLAAHKLGYVQDGSARVEVELLDPERPTMAGSRRPPTGAVVDARTPAAPSPAGPPPGTPAGTATRTSHPAAIAAPQAPQAPAGLQPTTQIIESSVPHYLQLGAFSAQANAEAASARLRQQLGWLQVPIRVDPVGSLYRVTAGPYQLREQAARAGEEVESRTGLRPLLLPRAVE